MEELKEHESVEWILKKIPLNLRSLFFKSLTPEITCFDVNQDILVFGTSNGYGHIISRDNTYTKSILLKKNVSISCVKTICTIDVSIAFGFENGQLIFLSVPFKDYLVYSEMQMYHVPTDIKCQINYICWSRNGEKLFTGDLLGNVVCTEINYAEKTVCSYRICSNGGQILQLCYEHQCLLVSTLKENFIWDMSQNRKINIGKQVRVEQGRFGACFINKLSNKENAEIVVARTDSKIWISDTSGIVKRSILLNFNSIFSNQKAIPLLPSVTSKQANTHIIDIGKGIFRYQLGNVLPLVEDLFLFWSKAGIVIMNIKTGSVEASSCHLGRILNVVVCSSIGSSFSAQVGNSIGGHYEIWIFRKPLSDGDNKLIRLSTVPLISSTLTIDRFSISRLPSQYTSLVHVVEKRRNESDGSIISEEFPARCKEDTVSSSLSHDSSEGYNDMKYSVKGITDITKRMIKGGEQIIFKDKREEGVEQALEITEKGLMIAFEKSDEEKESTPHEDTSNGGALNNNSYFGLDDLEQLTMSVNTDNTDINTIAVGRTVPVAPVAPVAPEESNVRATATTTATTTTGRNIRNINLMDSDDEEKDLDKDTLEREEAEKDSILQSIDNIDVEKISLERLLSDSQYTKAISRKSESDAEAEFPDLFSELKYATNSVFKTDQANSLVQKEPQQSEIVESFDKTDSTESNSEKLFPLLKESISSPGIPLVDPITLLKVPSESIEINNDSLHLQDMNVKNDELENTPNLEQAGQVPKISVDMNDLFTEGASCEIDLNSGTITVKEDETVSCESELTNEILTRSNKWRCHRGPSLSIGSKITSMAVNRRMIWLADNRGALYVGVRDSSADACGATSELFNWLQESTHLPTDKISTSPYGSIIYREKGGQVAVYTGITKIWTSKVVKEKVLQKTYWDNTMNDIKDFDVDDDLAVIVTKRGHLKVMNKINGRIPYRQTKTASVAGKVVMATCYKGIIWCVTEVDILTKEVPTQHIFACNAFADSKDELTISYWKMVPLDVDIIIDEERNMGNLGGSDAIKHIYLGAGELAWLLTKNNRCYFCRNITPETPNGDGLWFEISMRTILEIPSPEYAANRYGFGIDRFIFGLSSDADMRSRKRGASFAANNPLLLCVKITPKGCRGNGLLWLTNTEKNSPCIFFESHKEILGHRWTECFNPNVNFRRLTGLPALLSWKCVVVSGTRTFWLIHLSGELFCYRGDIFRSVSISNNLGKTELLAASETVVVVLTVNNNNDQHNFGQHLLMRIGVTEEQPTGKGWSFIKLPSLEEPICHLVCTEQEIWAIHKDTFIMTKGLDRLVEHGDRCEWTNVNIKLKDSTVNTKVSWLELLHSQKEEHPKIAWVISEQDGQIYMGTWNNDNNCFSWTYIQGPKAKIIRISADNLWMLEQGTGCLFVRCGINWSTNPTGDYWIDIPCVARPLKHLTVSPTLPGNQMLTVIGCNHQIYRHSWAEIPDPNHQLSLQDSVDTAQLTSSSNSSSSIATDSNRNYGITNFTLSASSSVMNDGGGGGLLTDVNGAITTSTTNTITPTDTDVMEPDWELLF